MNRVIQKAIGIFGITEDCGEGGFLLPDGRYLDFGIRAFEKLYPEMKGKRTAPTGYGQGRRHLDHDEIDNLTSTVRNIEEFQEAANTIRFHASKEAGTTISFVCGQKPTLEQTRSIYRCTRRFPKLVFDINDYEGTASDSGMMDFPTLSDIQKLPQRVKNVCEGHP